MVMKEEKEKEKAFFPKLHFFQSILSERNKNLHGKGKK